jgi:ABC-type transport system involved in multi-copper enzyme maturation permease subunit
MIFSLVAELRKLRRPLLLWLSGGAALLSIFFGIYSQDATSTDIKNARLTVEEQNASRPAPPELGLTKRGPEYERLLAEMRAGNEEWLRALQIGAAPIRLTQHPLGAASLAAPLSASMLGAFFVFLLAGAHVGGEWSHRTIKEILRLDGRRARFVALKVVSVWLGSLWLFISGWLGLALLGQLSQHLWPLPGSVSYGAALHASAPLVGRAVLVLLFFSVLGVCTAIVVRNPLAAFFGALVLAGGANFLAIVMPAQPRFMPARWVSTWMQFQMPESSPAVDHVWVDRSLHITPTFSILALTGLALLLLSVAVLDLRRRDVLS